MVPRCQENTLYCVQTRSFRPKLLPDSSFRAWISLAKYLDHDDHHNRFNHAPTTVDSRNNILFSTDDRRLALLGVDDLIVVQTPDALLIANRHQADDIKSIVRNLPDHLL